MGLNGETAYLTLPSPESQHGCAIGDPHWDLTAPSILGDSMGPPIAVIDRQSHLVVTVKIGVHLESAITRPTAP